MKHVSDDNKNKSGVGHKIIDSPKIKTVINKKLYIALVDTGASASICSEILYNAIKQSGETNCHADLRVILLNSNKPQEIKNKAAMLHINSNRG